MWRCWFLLSFHEKRIPPLQSSILLHFPHILIWVQNCVLIIHSSLQKQAYCAGGTFAWLRPVALSSHPHQNPIVESRNQQQCFLLFFLDTLSVFVLWASKPRRVCNQRPLTVLQRRGSGEPNTDWAQTLNITLFPRRAVSFILWRQATLPNPSPYCLPVSTEERV